MKIINNEEKSLNCSVLAVLASLAGIYLTWQLIGLRYTNHDDIYFQLYSIVFSGDYLRFAEYVAYNQARLQAFINMPIILWIHSLGNSGLFDIFNIGSFCILNLSIIWVLSKVGDLSSSLAIVTVTLFLFPLHYYFTFPQGFPVMAIWGLTFALISFGLLSTHFEHPNFWKLALSVFLFTCSLWGPEYNFVLHPILLLFIFIIQDKSNFKHFGKIAGPYAIGWAVSLTVYLYFSILSRENGADESGRLSFGFEFISWLKTFVILEQKSFIPTALWDGIRLASASTQGSPEIPTFLTFSNLWLGSDDWFSISVVFVLALIIFVMIFYWQKLSIKLIRYYSIFFTCIAIIPCLVVSGSAHYQQIVLNHYIQGHLVSFYSQLGFSSLIFLFFAYICNTISKQYLKLSILALSAITLASLTALTFTYNNVNRQVMTANKQKWEAMRELTTFVQSHRQDLKERLFYAPDFWTTSGVSGIPGKSPFNGQNYWSEYVKTVLFTPLKITNSNIESSIDVIIVKYFSTPEGMPVVILHEKISGKEQWRITLIAFRQVAGKILDRHEGNRIRKVNTDQWECTKLCVFTWDEFALIHPDSIVFDPDNHGPTRLLKQFLLPRESQFAYPLGRHSKFKKIGSLNDLKIINLGPQLTKEGIVPNLQQNGNPRNWIQVSSDKELETLQLVFDGQRTNSTTINPGVITAAISPEVFNIPGKKEIFIKQVTTGVLLPVGKFTVSSK